MTFLSMFVIGSWTVVDYQTAPKTFDKSEEFLPAYGMDFIYHDLCIWRMMHMPWAANRHANDKLLARPTYY